MGPRNLGHRVIRGSESRGRSREWVGPRTRHRLRGKASKVALSCPHSWAGPIPFLADLKAPPSARGQHRSLTAPDSAAPFPSLQLEVLSPATSGTATCVTVHAAHSGAGAKGEVCFAGPACGDLLNEWVSRGVGCAGARRRVRFLQGVAGMGEVYPPPARRPSALV